MSPVSNHVYERRLIEKYIAENGTDPVNNQPLSEEQLIDIKGAAESRGAARLDRGLERGRRGSGGCFGVLRRRIKGSEGMGLWRGPKCGHLGGAGTLRKEFPWDSSPRKAREGNRFAWCGWDVGMVLRWSIEGTVDVLPPSHWQSPTRSALSLHLPPASRPS